MEQKIDEYLRSWSGFKTYIEHKAKNRCILTNKNWLKLREYHLDQYLQNTQHPFGFLFRVKFHRPDVFKSIHCMPRFFHEYRMARDMRTRSIATKYVTFHDITDSEENI